MRGSGLRRSGIRRRHARTRRHATYRTEHQRTKFRGRRPYHTIIVDILTILSAGGMPRYAVTSGRENASRSRSAGVAALFTSLLKERGSKTIGGLARPSFGPLRSAVQRLYVLGRLRFCAEDRKHVLSRNNI